VTATAAVAATASPVIVTVKNVTFGMNYELPMVDQFLPTKKRRRRRLQTEASSVPSLEEDGPTVTFSETEEEKKEEESGDAPATTITSSSAAAAAATPSQPEEATSRDPAPHYQEILSPAAKGLLQQQHGDSPGKVTAASNGRKGSSLRVSRRDKQKKSTPMARSRVRYDMHLVPVVQRNPQFLQSFEAWWISSPACSSSSNQSSNDPTPHPPRGGSPSSCMTCTPCSPFLTAPGEEGPSSVVWIPKDRSEWEDSISEMTALCSQAAIRRHDFRKPFVPPLSRDYIRDRVDIDDPLVGYQIRHRRGWLQGFVLFTNFTTWTHGFHWDSRHALSNISGATGTPNTDSDGSLAAELEAQPRSGDPRGGGIVFPALAEIALLGGLGCGEYLLRMALQSIRENEQYKYVVLQATDQSKSFYERFGFVRVGAICQYGDPTMLAEGQEMTLMGYRHWTHAIEKEPPETRRTQLHDVPKAASAVRRSRTRGNSSGRHCYGSRGSTSNDLFRLYAGRASFRQTCS
jgi:hypothetical protein